MKRELLSNTNLLVMIIINISVTLILSINFIKKNFYVRALTIFIELYIRSQIIGYGLNVDILKAVVPSFSDLKNGVFNQVITSIGFPLLIIFLSNYIYKPAKN